MQIDEDQKIDDYISKLVNIVNQMKTCNVFFFYNQIVEKVIRTLSSNI